MNKIQLLAMLFACLLLAAFRWPTVLENPNGDIAPSFEFRDERPALQLESKSESLMITNCAYGSMRVGAKDIQPDPASLVADQLATKLNSALSGRKVVLKNLTLHVNNSIGMRAFVSGMYSGLIPSLMNDQTKIGCSADDLRGGYIASEIPVDPAKKVPVIIVLDIMVDQTFFHARCLKSYPNVFPSFPANKRSKPDIQQAWNSAVSETLSCAVDMLGQQLVKAFPDPSAQVLNKEAAQPAGAPQEAVPNTGEPAKKSEL